jgi:hypothetical protein
VLAKEPSRVSRASDTSGIEVIKPNVGDINIEWAEIPFRCRDAPKLRLSSGFQTKSYIIFFPSFRTFPGKRPSFAMNRAAKHMKSHNCLSRGQSVADSVISLPGSISGTVETSCLQTSHFLVSTNLSCVRIPSKNS